MSAALPQQRTFGCAGMVAYYLRLIAKLTSAVTHLVPVLTSDSPN